MGHTKDKLEESPKTSINKNSIREKDVEEDVSFEEYLTTLINKNKDKIKEITIRGKHVEKKGWKLSINLVRK